MKRAQIYKEKGAKDFKVISKFFADLTDCIKDLRIEIERGLKACQDDLQTLKA
jgi:hypothetical protein